MIPGEEIPRVVLDYAAPPQISRRRFLGDFVAICVAIFLMLIAIVAGLIDLMIAIILVKAWHDANTIDEQLAVLILGLFALIVLGVASVSMWLAAVRRIRGLTRNY